MMKSFPAVVARMSPDFIGTKTWQSKTKDSKGGVMTKRCRHEFETKADYPDSIICRKCQSIFTITDYLKWTPKQIMTLIDTLPLEIRECLLRRQAEIFAKENPDYYLFKGDSNYGND
jgi:hypothetical protein